MKHHALIRPFEASAHEGLWQARCGYVVLPSLNGPEDGPRCLACEQFEVAAGQQPAPAKVWIVHEVVPYEGQAVVAVFDSPDKAADRAAECGPTEPVGLKPWYEVEEQEVL